mgnify:FL=1|jgi:hypothetical protein
MPDDIITDAFKSMFPELKRHLDMTTLRHWSKKIANAKNIFKKSVKIISIRLFIYLNLSYTNKNAQF